ncbi:hypothetical protein, partial [Enterocloster bolteae]|uniref:hypothetical protein n=1 Tax=Enterocloster bolteae TaxID=208479 RepID=UPI003AB43967
MAGYGKRDKTVHGFVSFFIHTGSAIYGHSYPYMVMFRLLYFGIKYKEKQKMEICIQNIRSLHEKN